MQQQGHALRRLCRQGNTDLVAQMLDAGTPPDVPQDDGCTGLWLAAEHGCTDVVRLLLQRKATPHAVKTAGNISALFIAAQNGHTAIVELLLLHGANPNTAKTSGATPIFIASQQNYPDIVRALLRAGANHSAATNQGVQPLMIAAFQGNMQIVRLLLAAGADPNTSAQGRNVVEWAAQNGHRTEVQRAIDDHLRHLHDELRRKREHEMHSTPAVARRSDAHDQRGSAMHTPAAPHASSIVGSPGNANRSTGPAFGGYTPRYLVSGDASEYMGDASRQPHSHGDHEYNRVFNTSSFSEPLPSGVGDMAKVTGGITSQLLEQEHKRRAAFRGMVKRDHNAVRARADPTWITGPVGTSKAEQSIYATEQEWAAHKDRLGALEQISKHEALQLRDGWMYSAVVTEQYAHNVHDLRRKMIEAERANREQMEQSRRNAVEAGFAFPRLPEDKMKQLKGFMESGRGAQGPPPPLSPEPEPEPTYEPPPPLNAGGYGFSSPAASIASPTAVPSDPEPASPSNKKQALAEKLAARRAAKGA